MSLTTTTTAPATDLLLRNRAILCHFDSYSTALVFAHWPGGSLLWPGPLPEGAAPAEGDLPNDAEAVRQAAMAQLGLLDDDVVVSPKFIESVRAADGSMVRVHLLRFTTQDAPKPLLEAAGAIFKPLPQLRGAAPVELGLLREVFNLIIGGNGRHG
ncbi:hypothetical protein [Aquabacterium sp. OR-4]|uniref:hypothetical protein n=1 Tax=Aquabacterium sp. OR-4 TaxID=2978127 RepID=UPI0021B15AEC|nr:hypothetical protein [Aquabacterium sp. OR-4]MDT7835635.1 hypothetical protein [Aquabacterium sp. OR-4]